MAINLKLPKPKSSEGKNDKAPKDNQEKGIKRKKGKGNKHKRVKVPTKNYINVLAKTKKPFSLKKSLPVIIVIALLFVVFCKFFVVDRIAAIAKESNRVSTMQEELANINSEISSMKDLDDMYAHYTVSGMTDEELSRVSRVKAMRLLDSKDLHGNVAKSWNLTGNIMTVEMSGSSLRGLNQLATEFESHPIVERCVISSANKRTEANGNVSVTFTIYLQQEDKEGGK